MDELTVTIPVSALREGFEKAAQELFKSSYSNPIKDLLDKAVKEKESQIKKIIDEIINQAIGTQEFKERLANVVMERLVESALRKN